MSEAPLAMEALLLQIEQLKQENRNYFGQVRRFEEFVSQQRHRIYELEYTEDCCQRELAERKHRKQKKGRYVVRQRPARIKL